MAAGGRVPYVKSNMTANHKQTAARCISCTHFRNSPAYLESVFRGLNTMSSGHASVRKDDGVCLLHDLYLSADAHCEQYARERGAG
jgi:hypothetical protein